MEPTLYFMSPTINPMTHHTSGTVGIKIIVITIGVLAMPRTDRIPFITEGTEAFIVSILGIIGGRLHFFYSYGRRRHVRFLYNLLI